MTRPIADVLRQVHGGTVYEQAGALLADLVAAVHETRKSGSIKLELKVKANGENAVFIAASVSSKVPARALGETIFFIGADGDLVREDPRQAKLPLRSIDEPEGELREVNVG